MQICSQAYSDSADFVVCFKLAALTYENRGFLQKPLLHRYNIVHMINCGCTDE